MTAMSNFIEGYLEDPAQAVSEARTEANQRFWYDEFDDDMIYQEIGKPEFRLYEEIIKAGESEILSHARRMVSVA